MTNNDTLLHQQFFNTLLINLKISVDILANCVYIPVGNTPFNSSKVNKQKDFLRKIKMVQFIIMVSTIK
jgi:hypothetical protein